MVIFGTGVITGGLLVHFTEPHWVPHPHPAAPRQVQVPSPRDMRIEFLRRVQKELDLTEAQRDEINKILKDSQDRSRIIMEPVAPQLRQEVQHTREAFRQVLTPEQRKRFDELLRQQQHPVKRMSPPREPSATNNATTR
jgi:Spy/CpxP family protein refolding chaperone